MPKATVSFTMSDLGPEPVMLYFRSPENLTYRKDGATLTPKVDMVIGYVSRQDAVDLVKSLKENHGIGD